MVLRIARPNAPTRFIDLGPAAGRLHDWNRIRKTVDDLRPVPKPKAS